MQQAFRSAIAAAILATTLTGCGSSLYDAVAGDHTRVDGEQACTSAGLKPNTNQYTACMQDHGRARQFIKPGKPDDLVSPR